MVVCRIEANSTSQHELCWPLWLAATSPSGELCVSHNRPPNSLSLGIALKVPAHFKKKEKKRFIWVFLAIFFQRDSRVDRKTGRKRAGNNSRQTQTQAPAVAFWHMGLLCSPVSNTGGHVITV